MTAAATIITSSTGIIREEEVITMMELRMSNKECREWASAETEEETTTTTVIRRPRTAAATPYPNQTNITSSRRKLPKR